MDALAQHAEAPVQVIRDRSGIVIGRIEHRHLTGQVIARDAHGIAVGRYDEREGMTRDASGRIIARGNVLPALLVRP